LFNFQGSLLPKRQPIYYIQPCTLCQVLFKTFSEVFSYPPPATRVSAAVDFQFTKFILPCQALFRSFFLFFRLFSSRSQSAANFFIFARAIGLFRLFLSSKNRFFLRFFALLGASQASSPAPSHFLPYYI